MEDLSGNWRHLDERIEHVTEEIEQLAHGSESCRQLMTVPGIGPLIASAMVAAIGDGAAFAKDAIRVKIHDEGFVRNKAVYIALGIRPDDTKEILGIWIEQTEGAKFWLRVMNELKNRGIGDILIAVVDGLKGFPEAINAVFPQTVIQTCIVHLIRHSLEFVSWKDRKLVVPALKAIYRAKNAEAGLKALAEFEASFWGQRYPAIA